MPAIWVEKSRPKRLSCQSTPQLPFHFLWTFKIMAFPRNKCADTVCALDFSGTRLIVKDLSIFCDWFDDQGLVKRLWGEQALDPLHVQEQKPFSSWFSESSSATGSLSSCSLVTLSTDLRRVVKYPYGKIHFSPVFAGFVPTRAELPANTRKMVYRLDACQTIRF